MVKLAYIGGGSMFVPSIIHGVSQALRQSPLPFEVELSLYDVDADKAQRMAAYARVVSEAHQVALTGSVASTRAEALEGADVVLVSVWLHDEHQRLDRIHQELGFELAEEGPEVAAWAVACAPWSLGVAEEMRRYCPGALFVTVMNPTDVIAGVMSEAGGVRSAGLCVEVDGLRGALAYYFRVPAEAIRLRHGGVNHDGWVLSLEVDGQDGYALWRDRWPEIERDPNFHPGNRVINRILDLTQHLRSSGYHQWPYQVEQTPEQQALWRSWQGKRQTYLDALDEALRTRRPIEDPPGIHPERSKLNYPHTGATVGKLLQSIATGWASTIPLQVLNHGAITNFPDNAVVEVPTLVQGATVQPLPVGEMPEWLGGYTRLLAIQRRLIIDYLLDRQLTTLKRALAVLPMFGTTQQLNTLAEALHREFSTP